MSADDSVCMAVCPLAGSDRVAVAHKDAIVVTTKTVTTTIQCGHPVRALGFVPLISTEEGATGSTSSSYIVSGGDNKVLTLHRLAADGSSAAVVDTHGPVGKKVTHLAVIPTVGAASSAPFPALVAKAPTGMAPWAATPSAGFATKDAPSVALDDKDDEEEADDNNVKASGLSAKDGYAVMAGRYYANQVANVVFVNKFGEVYVIALLRNAATGALMFGPAPVFLLQHFSIFSTFSLAGLDTVSASPLTPSSGRLVTCDRDGHIRVSLYPAAFEIEQFLWNAFTPPQEGEERPTQQDAAAVVLGTADAKTIYVGDVSGNVSKWVSNASTAATVSSSAVKQPWSAAATFENPTDAATASTTPAPVNYGGVVGLALVDDEKILLVARDHYSTLSAVDTTTGAVTSVTTPKNGTPIVALVPLHGKKATAAVALLRDASLYLVEGKSLAFTPLLGSADAFINPATAATADAVPANWSVSLKTVDLYFSWKLAHFAQYMQRRGEERLATEERNKANPKTNEFKKGDANGEKAKEEKNSSKGGYFDNTKHKDAKKAGEAAASTATPAPSV